LTVGIDNFLTSIIAAIGAKTVGLLGLMALGAHGHVDIVNFPIGTMAVGPRFGPFSFRIGHFILVLQ
jgi:hypothetical protein